MNLTFDVEYNEKLKRLEITTSSDRGLSSATYLTDKMLEEKGAFYPYFMRKFLEQVHKWSKE